MTRSALVSLVSIWTLALAGAQETGREANTNQSGAEEKAISAADKQAAAALVQQHRSDLVFIKNKTGRGSGFIALMRGRKVLITNAHVIADLKGATYELLDRSPLRLGSASVAAGHDLAAYVVLQGGNGIPMATQVDEEVKIGDPVVVLGNAMGAGVVNTIQGEVAGIGPDRIEVSAAFELGNSGSPIIHLRTGKVIAVATYAELDTLLSGKEKLRRFGYRLDSAKTWQSVDWTRFYAEGELAARIRTATFELEDILSDFKNVRTGKDLRLYETPAIRAALDNYHSLTAQSSADSSLAARGLLASLREACDSDLAGAKYRFTYDYFRRQLERNEQIRNEITKALDKVLEQ